MDASTYAQALYRALENADESRRGEIIARLGESMRRRGHAKLARGVMQAYETIRGRAQAQRTVRLIIAKEADKERSLADVRAAYPDIDTTACRIVVEPALIGGWRLETGERVIDGSYKKKLLALYRRFNTAS